MIIITTEDPNESYCTYLVESHWAEMCELYGDEGPCLYRPADLIGPGCVFVVAWLEGKAIACGGLRPLAPGVGEVKRVYVAPAARNLGIARSIMESLEKHAVLLGYRTLTLETGTLQPFAIRLYEKMGYQTIAPYGDYAEDPRCVCYSKTLDLAAQS